MALDARAEARLMALLDERDIRDVLMKYCRGVDRCDQELIESCFHADAVDDHGNWIRFGHEVPKEIIERVKPGPDPAMHFLGNVRIEVEGDTAFAESYLLAFRGLRRDGRAFTRTRALRFVDRFTRKNDSWRISERNAVDAWNRVDEVIESMPDSALFRYGAKDRSDPVYAIRRGQAARDPDDGAGAKS
jgi:ketosteroid isomerase-like protein